MTNYEVICMHEGFFRAMDANGFKILYSKYKPDYERYVELRRNGCLKGEARAIITDDTGYGDSTIKRFINFFEAEFKI